MLFCPSMHVRVFDSRDDGADTPMIGGLSIPLAPYCEWMPEVYYYYDDDDDFVLLSTCILYSGAVRSCE